MTCSVVANPTSYTRDATTGDRERVRVPCRNSIGIATFARCPLVSFPAGWAVQRKTEEHQASYASVDAVPRLGSHSPSMDLPPQQWQIWNRLRSRSHRSHNGAVNTRGRVWSPRRAPCRETGSVTSPRPRGNSPARFSINGDSSRPSSMRSTRSRRAFAGATATRTPRRTLTPNRKGSSATISTRF